MQQLRADNQRLAEALNQAKTEEVRHEQRKNQFEIEVLDLKRAVQAARDDKTKAQAELAQARHDLDEEIAKTRNL